MVIGLSQIVAASRLCNPVKDAWMMILGRPLSMMFAMVVIE